MEEEGRRDFLCRGCLARDRAYTICWLRHEANRLPPSPLIRLFTPQETDKATIDVEAQDDGVLGKIIVRCP